MKNNSDSEDDTASGVSNSDADSDFEDQEDHNPSCSESSCSGDDMSDTSDRDKCNFNGKVLLYLKRFKVFLYEFIY